MTTIDLDRDAVFELVDGIVRDQNCNAEVKLGHISENGQHVEIEGAKPALLKMQTAFEQKGHVCSVFD